MIKTFRPYTLDQHLLLPSDLRAWLPDDHLALFISDVVDELDLSAIYAAYETGDERGQPPYHPAMMVKLLLYAYCTGRPSSRKIERATHEDVAFRVLAGDQHPDHDSIAAFCTRHLPALAGLFVQGLELCQAAGLVTLGHVASDGTKVKANASKHKAMSYARMSATEQQLEREVRALLEQAERVDAAEDAQYGAGRRGDELPAELARRETRLARIRAAKAALEQQAKERAEKAADAARAKVAAREQRVGSAKGGVPKVPDPEQAQPEPTAQLNFTDPESRIMVDGATKLPVTVTADAGFFSEANVTAPHLAGIACYVPPDRRTHGRPAPPRPWASPVAEAMRAKLDSVAGRAIYARRKTLPEPVFGQIKEGRGFRRGGVLEPAPESLDQGVGRAGDLSAQGLRLTDDGARDRHHVAVERGHPRVAPRLGGRRAAAGGAAALDDLEDAAGDAPRAIADAHRVLADAHGQALHRPGQDPHPVGQQRAVARIVDVRLDHGRVDPQPSAAGHAPPPGDLHQPLQEGLERVRLEELRQADERLGVRHALAIDAAEGPVDEAAPDLALALVEAPVAEMLEQEHAQDDGDGRPETPATAAQRVSAAEGGFEQVNEGIIVQDLVDRPELGVPELVPVGQQHFEDAALRIRATDHGPSMESGRLRCAVSGSVSEIITRDDGAASPRASRKLSVLPVVGRRSPRNTRASALSFAPESS